MATPSRNSATALKTVSAENIRVLIVDDQDFMRNALRRLLEAQSFLKVCGEARDGIQALQKAIELKPQVIVMDINMPGMDGLEATRRIHNSLPNIEVLIFTQHELLNVAQAAKDAGASGCVSKSEAAHQLVPALRTVSQHQHYLPDPQAIQ